MRQRSRESIFLSLHDFSLREQLVLGIGTDRMQFVPAHQVVDVLPGTIKDTACLRSADNAMLHIMMQGIQRQGNCHAVRKQLSVW